MTPRFMTAKGAGLVSGEPYYIGHVQHDRAMSKREAYVRWRYAHRRGVYRRNLPAAKAGRRYFIRFRRASQWATVRVNGTTIGHHVGAFTAFCCEATRQMKPEVNLLENIYAPDVPPAGGDFTVYGGLHRGSSPGFSTRIAACCVATGGILRRRCE